MRIGGKVNVKASRENVWNVLTDTESVSQCTPGLESLEIIVPGRKFKAVGALVVGAIKVGFKADVEWLELEPPHRAVMKMSGRGRKTSFKVGSEALLSDGVDGSTDLQWAARVKVKGTANKLTARLLKPVINKVMGKFFKCLKKRMESGGGKG